MSIQALREQRAAAAKALKELVEAADWDASRDQPIYDKGLAELDAIDARIKRIEEVNAKVAEDARREDVAAAAERKGVDNRDEGLRLYAKWLRGGDAALNAAEWAAVRNTMSTTTGSEGGFTVATEVARQVLDALKAFGGVRQVATVLATASGAPMSFPTSDGTNEEGEIVPENQSATDQDVSFGTIALPVYKFGSKVITVPVELLQDSNVDVEAFVSDRISTRLGRITNRLYTTGNGAAQPRGVQFAAPVGVTAPNGSSQVTAVTYASLVDLQHSVDPAYRQLNRTRWMFNDMTLRQLRKVVDGTSRPIFVPGYETGNPLNAPDTILGRPIVINQAMPDMAASAKSILFGDFSFYTIRDVMAMELLRFTDSAYAKKGQVGFLAWMRTGGNLVDVGGAVKAFVNAAS